MKPVDAVSGLPRSPDIARVAAAQGRLGETQMAVGSQEFTKQMTERREIVTESSQARNSPESDSPGGNATWEGPDPGGRERQEEEKPGTAHPTKGKILDIRGV